MMRVIIALVVLVPQQLLLRGRSCLGFSPLPYERVATWRTSVDNEIVQRGLFTNRSRKNGNNNDVELTRIIYAHNAEVPVVEWEVYVDQSKPSLERGGGATLDAFFGLASPTTVLVQPALLSSSVSSNSKAPVVRCIAVNGNVRKSLDVTNVDSVDKVFRILTKHMGQRNVSQTVCNCLKYKYKGNGHVEGGKVDLAIDAYNKALQLADEATQQQGMILLMRATAYLKRAAKHQQQLKEIVQQLDAMVPSQSTLGALYEQANESYPTVALAMFRKVIADCNLQEQQFRRTQYRHGLYQYALLQAAADALRATQLLPYTTAPWCLAGEILCELWKLQESAQYYERAIALDETLDAQLRPIIDKLRVRQELLDTAKVYGWSEDSLRLALDVSR
jgi:hypothetical protein